MFGFVVFDFCFLCSTPPVQSKIASFSSLTLRSQRRSSTVAKRQTRRLSFFTQKWLNSACAIKDCFVLFAYAPFTTAVGYGFALSAEALLRRHGLTHLMERECSQSAHKCTIAPYSRSTPAHLHPTLSLNILRSHYPLALVQRSHLLLLLRLLLILRIHCSRGHGFLHRFLLCFLMYRDT